MDFSRPALRCKVFCGYGRLPTVRVAHMRVASVRLEQSHFINQGFHLAGTDLAFKVDGSRRG